MYRQQAGSCCSKHHRTAARGWDMGPLPSLMNPQLRPNHETKSNLGLHHVLSHFTPFSVGRHFSGQAWMELLCTTDSCPSVTIGAPGCQRTLCRTVILTSHCCNGWWALENFSSSLRAINIDSHWHFNQYKEIQLYCLLRAWPYSLAQHLSMLL